MLKKITLNNNFIIFEVKYQIMKENIIKILENSNEKELLKIIATSNLEQEEKLKNIQEVNTKILKYISGIVVFIILSTLIYLYFISEFYSKFNKLINYDFIQ
jgi:hypothetical protein